MIGGGVSREHVSPELGVDVVLQAPWMKTHRRQREYLMQRDQ